MKIELLKVTLGLSCGCEAGFRRAQAQKAPAQKRLLDFLEEGPFYYITGHTPFMEGF